MKKEKEERRKPSLGIAVMWRVVAIVLGSWLICMCYTTAMVARSVYLDYVHQVNAYVQRDGRFDYDAEKDEIENYASKIRGLRGFDPDTPNMDIPLYSTYMRYTHFIPRFNWDWPDQAARASEQWSVSLYDSNAQQIIGQNNHVYLTYRDYYKGQGTSSEDYVCGYTYIDLSRTRCGQAMIEEWKGQGGFSDTQGYGNHPYRLTGYFDGVEFVLLKVERDQESFALMPDWRCVYDGISDYEGETVVIYPAEMVYDRCAVQVTLHGQKWELEELGRTWSRMSNIYHVKYSAEEYERILSGWEKHNQGLREFLGRWNSNNLFESVITRSGAYLDENGENCQYVVVLRVQPVRVATAMLTEVYFLTFIPVALILFFFCRRIRRELIAPLGHILRHPDLDQAAPLYKMMPKYREPVGLLNIFNQAQQDIHELKKENTQMETALDYAHNAEENRRRMVSNITHELKTPLAVIHSYAEGLKEGIAADRQEHYLDVILEEAERMDGMVLEMLDLSRLEAGKVRLASDRFSLLELTHHVFDKLKLLIEEKELKVEYVWPQNYEITADEGRITQAVTNLVSNAIKYSPRGGAIYVSVTKAKEKAMFAIENQSQPLSDEALAKVWDSFYQTDASRTEKGTGLGLPITKAVIELHGGTCHVTNTATGVEFKFYLP